MKTTLRICGSNRKTPAIRVTMDEGKRRIAQNTMRRDGSETGFPVVFFFPKGALTHHLLNATHFGGGGIPPVGRAVRSARRTRGRFVLCGERRTTRAPLLSSAQLSVLSWTAQPGISGMLRRIAPPDICFCKICQRQVLHLWADVLHPVVAGHLTGHSA